MRASSAHLLIFIFLQVVWDWIGLIDPPNISLNPKTAEILRMERQGDGGLAPLPSSSAAFSAARAMGEDQRPQQQGQRAAAADASGRRKGLLRFVSEASLINF